MAKAEEKKLLKKVKLLESASELFLEKGVNITAIDDIVKKAGVAKGTFYLYFKDKYDLLDEIVIYRSKAIFNEALYSLKSETSKSEMSLTDQVIFLTDYIVRFLENNSNLVSVIQKNLTSCITYYIEDKENKDEMQQILSVFCENGFTEEETFKLIYLLNSMVSSACCDAVLYKKPYSAEEILPAIHFVIEKTLERSDSK